ncbi:DNRLRE domain-containing protein, partial [Streptomyces galilaeus]
MVTDATRVRLVPVEDSYVQSTTASTNYGSSSGLLSKPTYGGSPDRIAYFKFDVSALAGKTVTSAVLSTSNQITDGPLDVAR